MLKTGKGGLDYSPQSWGWFPAFYALLYCFTNPSYRMWWAEAYIPPGCGLLRSNLLSRRC